MLLGNIICSVCGKTTQRKKDRSYECPFCGSKYEVKIDDSRRKDVIVTDEIFQCYVKATNYIRSHTYTFALEELQKAIELDKNNATTFVKIGNCYDYLKEKDKAFVAYSKALEIDPENIAACLKMGCICLENSKWNDALNQFSKVLAPEDQFDSDYWLAYGYSAIAMAKLGNIEKAKEMLSRAGDRIDGDRFRSAAGIKKESSVEQGCYIATAVYGDYDCPEVWTLRRYRDYKLNNTYAGRMFIKTYYKVSPKLVKMFGEKWWFNKPIKGLLDRIVLSLQQKGYNNTEYFDEK